MEQPDATRAPDLHLDRVAASAPELGPAPPDGGWGWLVAAAGFLHGVTAPAVLLLYGVIIVKANKEQDREAGHVARIWDINIVLVPIIFIVIRLLLETWCRTIVKIYSYPRFMALAGLCLTVAGVLLSSFATNVDDNEYIINIFSGFFAGAGSALTGQQTDIIIKHYFRLKLPMAQTFIRMAPSVGNCVIPIFVGALCSMFTNDIVIMIYGAVLMQNCFFLAAYTRPIYITKPLSRNYKILKDAEEDEDEDIFTKNRHNADENPATSSASENPSATNNTGNQENNNSFENTEDADEHVIATFNSNSTAKEITQPSVELDDTKKNENRFSSDFSSLNVLNSYRVINEQELERVGEPQPLYRETTVVNENENGYTFAFDQNVTQGTARRNTSMKKNIISVISMLLDIDFYLYTLLHVNTTYCIFILGVIFPALLSDKVPQLNTFRVSTMVTVTHSAAFCFILFCIILPKSINKKARLCASFCIVGAIGFYGVSVADQRSFLIIWGVLASFATSSTAILQQPIYDDILNEFDATATSTVANFLAAGFLMIWSHTINYEYGTCFQMASLLQVVTALVFIASSLRKKRR